MLAVMRTFLRLIGIPGGLGLITLGLFQSNDRVWLALLWGGMALLGIGLAAALQGFHGGVRRGVLNLSLVFSLLFGLLSAQLLRTQFVQADRIYDLTVQDQSGSVTGNPRPVTRSLKVQRGAIYDRNNTQLVGSEAAPTGFARRTYPVAQIADIRAFSSILGFTSPNYGQYGLEQQWDDYLNGTKGQPLRAVQDEVLNRPHIGNNMQLTLDARLQAAVWDEVNRLAPGKAASAIVFDPRSGAVLALVSVPGYDPQALTFDPFADDWEAMGATIADYWGQINADPQSPLINRPLNGRYAPGSVFKTVTAVSALMNPEVLEQPLLCPNEYRPDPNAPPVINAVGPPARPQQASLESFIRQAFNNTVDLSGAYAFSCNTAFAELGVRLGEERLTATSRSFNFFPPREAPDYSPDFTDLPAEASLLALRGTFLASPLAVADTAFGQGQLLVTPMQMALVAGAIANDGVLPEPYLVERITDPEGAVAYQHAARPGLLQRRVMSSAVAAQMRELMRLGVTTGFGKAAAVAGQTVGGKSGSAQAGAGDDPNAIVHAWFIAIAPVEQPRYAVAVMIEDGRDGAGLGAVTAGAVLARAFALEQ